jgi:hypothetical protein
VELGLRRRKLRRRTPHGREAWLVAGSPGNRETRQREWAAAPPRERGSIARAVCSRVGLRSPEQGARHCPATGSKRIVAEVLRRCSGPVKRSPSFTTEGAAGDLARSALAVRRPKGSRVATTAENARRSSPASSKGEEHSGCGAGRAKKHRGPDRGGKVAIPAKGWAAAPVSETRPGARAPDHRKMKGTSGRESRNPSRGGGRTGLGDLRHRVRARAPLDEWEERQRCQRLDRPEA